MDNLLLVTTIFACLYALGMTACVIELMKQRQAYRNALAQRDGTLSHIRRLKDNIPICQRPTEWNEFVRVDPYVKGVQSCVFCDATIRQWGKMKV